MASAQVLKKQEHLEAGKRKLEEFRRKKAAQRAKKATPASQVHTSEIGLNEKQRLESEHLRLIDSDAPGTCDSIGAALLGPSGVVTENDSRETDTSQKSSCSFPDDANANASGSANHFDISTSVPVESHVENKEFSSDRDSQLNTNYSRLRKNQIGAASDSAPYGVAIDEYLAPHLPFQSGDGTSRQSNFGLNETFPNNSDIYLRDLPAIDSRSSEAIYANGFPENSGSALEHDKSGYGDHLVSSSTSSFYEEVVQRVGSQESNISMVPNPRESKFSGSPLLASAHDSYPRSANSSHTGFNSSNHGQMPLSSSGTSIRRSRPSFLDSINISKGPSVSASLSGVVKVEPFSSKVLPDDTLGSSVSQNSAYSLVASGNGIDSFKKVMEKNIGNKQDFHSQKQDEDFAALEQHIEDLTQEKFSLQRALEASRTLAESLAAENSALTDSYNQQESVVNQLKSDMEKLQEEIKANLVELESIKVEYANAQLESNAADERAKLLASEVIGLEEKALRLRSNELKLERQLEESQAEISSFKKRMSSLEKERQDLQSSIDALKEEKKLLQSKLRKASGTGKFVDVAKITTNKKDGSTSTDDLGETNDLDANMGISEMEGSLRNDASSHPILHENGDVSLQELSVAFPLDQIRMIENIKALISELTLEKEELMQVLSTELSQSSKLKELNKELTWKLETQTQRLELLTAQSMVNEGIPPRNPDSHPLLENAAYADKGDEVVEKVLGWIMKLFPGGPSRRRSSKLL